MDRPSWLAPSPTRVCVSAVDQALPQIDTAAPNPSIVWYLVAGLTVMSAAEAGGAVVGPVVGVVVGAVVGVVVGPVLPVQVTPLTAKPAGTGLLPVHEPLKPNET